VVRRLLHAVHKKFSQISYPMTSLQRKGKKIECTNECVASFEKLKKLLKNSLVLRISYLDKDFMVCKDACKRRLGGVLI